MRTAARYWKHPLGRGPKPVRPMSQARAAREFPGYPLQERLAVTAMIEHQAAEAKRRGVPSTHERKMQVVRERQGRGLSADYYAGPRPWLEVGS